MVVKGEMVMIKAAMQVKVMAKVEAKTKVKAIRDGRCRFRFLRCGEHSSMR